MAARFSFLLGAPVIAGAGLLKIGQLLGAGLDAAQLAPLSGRDGHGVCRGVRRDSALTCLRPRTTTAHLRHLPPGSGRAHRRWLVLRPPLAAGPDRASLPATGRFSVGGPGWGRAIGSAGGPPCSRWWVAGGSAPARRHRPDRRPARPGRWTGGQGGCREWQRRGTRRPESSRRTQAGQWMVSSSTDGRARAGPRFA